MVVVEVDVELVEVLVLDVLVEVDDVEVDVLVEVLVEVELDVDVDVPYSGLSLTDTGKTLWNQYRIVKNVVPSGVVAGVTVFNSTILPSIVEADGAA